MPEAERFLRLYALVSQLPDEPFVEAMARAELELPTVARLAGHRAPPQREERG